MNLKPATVAMNANSPPNCGCISTSAPCSVPLTKTTSTRPTKGYIAYSNLIKAAFAARHASEIDNSYRQIDRRRAVHRKAWDTFCKMVTHLRKHHSQAVRDPKVRDFV